MKDLEKRQSMAALSLFFALLVFLGIVLFAGVIVLLAVILSRTGVLPDLNLDISSSQLVVFLVVLFSLLIGFGLSYIISRTLARPVATIVRAMHELASGNYKARLDPKSSFNHYPAFREVTESFNTLAEELDHTEILRSDFVNNFSHEFKTPIVSIAGFAKLLKRGNLDEAQKAEYTNIIEEESLRLSDMATNMLNLTKVENQTILTDVTSYNLSEQIRGCVLLLEEKWTRKHLEFSLDFPEVTVSANEDLLRQVWINLLDNAVKFSREGGEVAIFIHQDDTSTRVSISDSGTPIAPEERDRIFRKFYQADHSHSSEGHGIGLAIVQKIVDLHRGSIAVTEEGGSTVFTVRLPRV